MRPRLPGSPRDIAARSATRRALYSVVFRLADIFGFWSRPQDIDPDGFQNLWADMYYQYKCGAPIVKPQHGMELEPFYAAGKHLGVSLFPDEFEKIASVDLSAVGDLLAPKDLENSEGRFYERAGNLIFHADLSMANLESTLTRGEIGDFVFPADDEPMINASVEQYNALRGHQDKQYSIFQTANNHILDRGIEGFDTTHEQLEADGILYLGTNRTPEDQEKGLVVTSRGIRLGFIGATYSLNSRPFPDGKEYLVNVVPFHRFRGPVDLSLLERQIGYCKRQDCDFVLLCLHWGLEFEFFPRQEQIDIAHHLVEFGADAVISHHAHNIQPVEFYHTKRDPDRIAPILYGLGNLSSLISAPYSVLSLIASLTIAKGWLGGTEKTLVERVRLTPVVQMEYDLDTSPYLRIEILRDALEACQRDEERRSYLEQVAAYADLVLGKDWRS